MVHHYMRHINVRPFVCDKCGYAFTQSGTLARHVKQMHTPKTSAIFSVQRSQRDSAKKKKVLAQKKGPGAATGK